MQYCFITFNAIQTIIHISDSKVTLYYYIIKQLLTKCCILFMKLEVRRLLLPNCQLNQFIPLLHNLFFLKSADTFGCGNSQLLP